MAQAATLAKQIAEAAPADIFISADLAWMDDVAKKNLIKPESRKNLVGNTLVLVAAAGTDLKIELAKDSNLAASLGDEKLAVGDVKSVPAGKYAKAALENLGLWASVEAKSCHAGKCPQRLGIGCPRRSQAWHCLWQRCRGGIKGSGHRQIPRSQPPPIVYPAAVIAASTNPDAQPFLTFLFSKEAQLIFKANGFTLLE